MLISLVQYATNHNKNRSNLARMAKEGRFKTAQKIGRNWLIDSNEKFPMDKRKKQENHST